MLRHVADQLRFVAVAQNDPLAAPLLAELAVEYAERYAIDTARVLAWLHGYPAEEFTSPDGALLIGLSGANRLYPAGQPVTGGAFRRFDALTAELKRIWTDRAHRRHGYGRALLTELEARIAARGYRRIYLTTGDQQPEAEALYLSAGYVRLDKPLPGDREANPLAFLKELA